MNKPLDLPLAFIDPDDLENNRSGNPTFQNILDAGMKRRSVLRGGVGAAMATMFGAVGLTGCGGGDSDSPAPAPTETLLGFTAVAKNTDDDSTVPEGYTATTIFATGDPMAVGVAALANNGNDTDWFNRAGDCHDGIQYFGLSAAGAPDAANGNDRALLAMNHEYITPWILHAAGPSARPRPASETDKEVACHGVSVIEIAKNSAGVFEFVQDSDFNRRLTGETAIEISGPVRGHPLLVTAFSTNGTRTRGSMNNCGNGKTPWGTLLTTEENWSGYYFRAAGDDALRTAKVNAIFQRYGRNATATSAAASRYGWETSGADDKYRRWNTSVVGVSVDGSDDYRHEWFGQGWMVEMDPYDPTSVIKKRSALGRFAHENGAFGLPVAGQPLAVYMGCDSQNEYVYKYVSNAVWDPADATAANRVATGDKYLDDGRLYAAIYNDDGTGEWVELSLANADVAGAAIGFADQAEILIAARIAADAAGATRMDRPEWVDVHPTTGEIYITMTNNSSRAVGNVDAANPRAYSDIRGGTQVQNGNVNGHIVRMNEASASATSFTWDVYLFGAEADANPQLVNLSGLTADQDFSSCDGLAFSASTGLCWIQTDDGAFTDVTNCMMLAAIPGQVGDGTLQTVSYPDGTTVDTYVGARPTAATLKRFYVGPAECEVTGYCETPDGTVGFLNIQHPGDSTPDDFGDAATYGSTWPANEGYGAGQRPRSATVMVTKNDGGRIGS